MILAKCCHDADIIQWLIGKDCKKVQSFGSLSYFTPENKPQGAPDRCTDGCPHIDTCPYSAIKLYYDDKHNDWFRSVAINKVHNGTDEEVMEALKTGPYGRCVFGCDNDVVDHQVVNMEFEGGATATLTMNCFNKGGRNIRIYGTKGELSADMGSNVIKVFSFDTRETTEYDLEKIGQDITSGHGGGDDGIMIDSLKYFTDSNPSNSINSVATSYLNHLICFAAEESRLNGTVIDLDVFSSTL
jgi:predicted dehydrogenase